MYFRFSPVYIWRTLRCLEAAASYEETIMYNPRLLLVNFKIYISLFISDYSCVYVWRYLGAWRLQSVPTCGVRAVSSDVTVIYNPAHSYPHSAERAGDTKSPPISSIEHKDTPKME